MSLTIYTKPSGCFGCTKTKQKFTEAGIPFHEVDVTASRAAFEYITEELGYSQVPVVVYEKDGTENHWSGLNPGRIAQVITIENTTRENTLREDKSGENAAVESAVVEGAEQ